MYYSYPTDIERMEVVSYSLFVSLLGYFLVVGPPVSDLVLKILSVLLRPVPKPSASHDGLCP